MKKNYLIFLVALLSSFLFSCSDKSEYYDPRGKEYAGAESCIQCHKTTYESSFHSAHFKATAPASVENVLGNFSPGFNTFDYGNDVKVVMEKRKDSFYQVLYDHGKEVRAFPFEIVFGSRNAQTSMYWHNNNTYELPISHYKSVDKWATSPGFSAEKPYFNRKAVKDCYACHSSNASSKTKDKNVENSNFLSMDVEDVMDKNAMILGIDCERCHGPAKKHVDYHSKFPATKIAHDIVTFKSLNNKQKLDACAVCHSGNNGLQIKSRFDFKPGDNLADFYSSPPQSNQREGLDVHGNQAGALSQSQCFIQSKTMNCVTCHNPHQNNTGNLASFSAICVSCHNGFKHSENTIKNTAANIMKDNCIECHMPKQTSRAIAFQLSKDPKLSGYLLRTHKIAVYPTKK